ncbi:BTAD domain-containing putative transcriptional regulator [Streptomyces pseudovenezuelae]|uniref:DNA-binding SARP family transcriptional activator n=1 Tax=Streptomyces pseudovenezuelae TaxID=67350 RepID=A0ABT6LEN8_9ACTN|nr:BTAD domain-containing putative transcriptional regulator [Streptomyces pseudovenezuelae]MDH6214249.1 DNA-binding SARP family transcriptional activator [Streptomyces pseudovenezuelae]
MGVRFGLLGPVAAWDADGVPVALGAPRHREVLGRLLIARNRVVPVGRLVADLWEDGDAPAGAVGAVRTFVAALRRALEPERAPRQASRLLVTDGPGYVLHAGRDVVDAWRFEDTVARAAAAAPRAAVALWDEALALWRGPVLADFPGVGWAAAEQARLEALRLHAVERRADALLATGAAREAVVDLEAHVVAHPWREDGWVLLATALERSGRRGDALEAVRRARHTLAERLGIDPGPALTRAEARLLKGSSGSAEASGAVDGVWGRAAAAWERAVPARSRARLHATAALLRDLAVTGADGLEEAREHRRDVVAAAEATGDAELAARIIGSYDVPAVWTRADDSDDAGELSRAAARAAAALAPGESPALRARLLSVVAVESRGDAAADGPIPRASEPSAVEPPSVEPWRLRAERAAEEAVRLARRLGDPALLAFALNGAFMQSFGHCGGATGREALGREMTDLAVDHGLPSHEVLGRLVRLQALAALGELTAADAEAEAIDRLAHRHERPLAVVFTSWFRALRTCETDGWPTARPLYTHVLAATADSGMPGLVHGAAALVALVPFMRENGLPRPGDLPELDAGPYQPWLRPLLLAGAGATEQARQALDEAPRPPHDLLQEAMWCVLARAACAVGHERILRRARDELTPAATESAGAGSGLISYGPVEHHLHAIDSALGDGYDRNA